MTQTKCTKLINAHTPDPLIWIDTHVACHQLDQLKNREKTMLAVLSAVLVYCFLFGKQEKKMAFFYLYIFNLAFKVVYFGIWRAENNIETVLVTIVMSLGRNQKQNGISSCFCQLITYEKKYVHVLFFYYFACPFLFQWIWEFYEDITAVTAPTKIWQISFVHL